MSNRTWSCRTHADNEWCKRNDVCFDCAELAHAELHPSFDEPDCETCKLRSVQLSPAATPTKTRKFGPLGQKGNNSWERGIVTDDRGMPTLKADGSLIRNHEAAGMRSVIEDGRRRLHNGDF